MSDIIGLRISVILPCSIMAGKRITGDVIVSGCSALYRCRHSHHGNQTRRGGGCWQCNIPDGLKNTLCGRGTSCDVLILLPLLLGRLLRL
jgi:hypothetical protein